MTQLLQQQLDDGAETEVVKQGVVDMGHAISRTDVLVQDLLDTALMNTNMFMLHREHRDLVELCHDLLNEFTLGAGPALTCEIHGKPLESEVDGNRLRQVFMNLLSNARKYSPKGSPITVTLQQSGYEAIISVRDMGIGIPAEAIPHIFKEFYRVPGVQARDGARPGLGLGLYIARKIVERHGGRIDVESTPGEGSVFSITLPLAVMPASRNLQSSMLSSHTPHMQAIWTIIY
jgi:signal transduction histidine kinase